MFNGKMKALTFSYDDGVKQDIRLIDIFNKYGLKGTFNINSECLGNEGYLIREGVRVGHNKVNPQDVKYVYEGHEVAAHTLNHPALVTLDDDEVVRQAEQDRINLSGLVGYEVVGMAYPGGGTKLYDERVKNLIRTRTGVKYARVTETTGNFDIPQDMYELKGSIYHHKEWNKLFETGQRFLELEADKPQIMYIWGHAYEFDIYPERWEIFEEFCRMMSGRNDIFYGTNREVLL